MLADFRTLVDDLVRDRDQVISSTQRDSAIDQAVQRYSGDRPRPVVVDATVAAGPGLDLPAGWQSDFSTIVSVEYPIGSRPPVFLEAADLRLYESPLSVQIQLPDDVNVGDSARLTYTQRHAVDDSTDTVPLQHRLAVSYLAAAILSGQLANYYATSGEPTIAADAVDHHSKSDKFRARERDFRARYLAELGVADKRSGAAGVQVDWDGKDSRGNDRLFHRRRYR